MNNINYARALPKGMPVVLIYCSLGPFLAVQNIEFQYFLGVFRQMKGMKKLWNFYLGRSLKKRTVFGRHLYAF